MRLPSLSRKIIVLASALMIIGGIWLTLWLIDNRPSATRSLAVSGESQSLVEALPTPVITDPLVVAIGENLPPEVRAAISRTQVMQPGLVITSSTASTATLRLDWSPEGGTPIYEQTFAVAARFNTIFPTTTLTMVHSAWAGETSEFSLVAVLTDTLPALEQLLGPPGDTVQGYGTVDEILPVLFRNGQGITLLPFDQLVPSLMVFAVDGQNPVENSNLFDPAQYKLVASLYLQRLQPTSEEEQIYEADLLAAIPPGNRDSNRITVLAMTGVTAMTRLTAQQMDKLGNAWPAEVIGPELAAADLTHISNEVPFVEDCKTDIRMDNFNFCSKPEYLEALRAVGVDLIGLTGNHQNDYGRDNALKSLAFYEAEGIPVYGGGVNKAAASAPFLIEDHGNRFAFLGANSYGPALAWAKDDAPGSAKLDVAELSATIREIRANRQADLILVELQYHERYEVEPFIEQRIDFNALLEAGADIVTGVQSHVPQSLEFTNGKLILYGLGNLFFDQMASQATREGMIVKHTFYRGRHISTQILTTLVHDYGQPRWTTPQERQALLQRVFAASYWEY